MQTATFWVSKPIFRSSIAESPKGVKPKTGDSLMGKQTGGSGNPNRLKEILHMGYD